mmetsp:Transcript_46235/g.91358  ORF Transcript_46235/g.91358 Transcript_46235/m.91358 type:complete len:203 (+) Transcript_46235:195-803(+)
MRGRWTLLRSSSTLKAKRRGLLRWKLWRTVTSTLRSWARFEESASGGVWSHCTTTLPPSWARWSLKGGSACRLKGRETEACTSQRWGPLDTASAPTTTSATSSSTASARRGWTSTSAKETWTCASCTAATHVCSFKPPAAGTTPKWCPKSPSPTSQNRTGMGTTFCGQTRFLAPSNWDPRTCLEPQRVRGLGWPLRSRTMPR